MMTDEAPEKIDFQTPPSGKDFWIVHAHSLDWQILMHKFVLEFDPNHGKTPLDPKVAFIGYSTADMTPVYYLSREFFPIERIAKLIGKTVESLAGIETLHLRDIKGQEDWPKPNVDYWGMS
jgi:hypothetical protein